MSDGPCARLVRRDGCPSLRRSPCSRSRARGWKALAAGAIAAAGALLATPGEARAADGAVVGIATGLVALAGADIVFAAHDLDAAAHSSLARDGWLTAQTVVTVPQTLFFNGLLVGFNADKSDELGTIGSALGLIPTAGVTALTTHGIWGIADNRTQADAMAGISVLVGTNFALTMAALGRASRGRLHERGIGIFAMILAAPGVGVGAYESSFQRPQQGAWAGLTAWSGALFVHGLISAIAEDPVFHHRSHNPTVETPPPPPDSPASPPPPELQKAARHPLWPATFSVAPTVLSDGVARMPGLMATGTF